MKYILYNPLSSNGQGTKNLGLLKELRLEGAKVLNVTELDTKDFYTRIKDDDEVIIAGGDGTLNRFVNEIYDIKRPVKLLYFKGGNGNDFGNDLKDKFEDGFIHLNPYIENLPLVTMNGESKRFLNNAAFGLDGYCCEQADELRKAGKQVNYSAIALKGLFGAYKNTNAKVTVDGVTTEYTDVLMVPTMKGRYYGGGIMIAPQQDRTNKDGMLTVVVIHNLKKISIPYIFPRIFSGKHAKFTNVVTILEGKNIKVEFDEPRAMQIDGETILNVTSYEVQA